MYNYGRKSMGQWKTLYPYLGLILLKVLREHDHSIDTGGRTDEKQWSLFNANPPRTTLHPPQGKHLLREDPSGYFDGKWSFAADITPFINGRRLATSARSFGPDQRAQFAYFLGIFKAEADRVLEGTGWKIRLGINWDMDAEILSDQSFDDWFHVELIWVGRT